MQVYQEIDALRTMNINPLHYLVLPRMIAISIALPVLVVFSILIGTALYFRRRRLDIHKRLMLLAALSMLGAAIARIPVNFILTGGPLVFFGLTDLCILAFVAYDTIKHRRLHPAFLWGALLVIASHPLRLMLAGTDIWMRFASWLVS